MLFLNTRCGIKVEVNVTHLEERWAPRAWQMRGPVQQTRKGTVVWWQQAPNCTKSFSLISICRNLKQILSQKEEWSKSQPLQTISFAAVSVTSALHPLPEILTTIGNATKLPYKAMVRPGVSPSCRGQAGWLWSTSLKIRQPKDITQMRNLLWWRASVKKLRRTDT